MAQKLKGTLSFIVKVSAALTLLLLPLGLREGA